jgi:hypothetical protein
MADNVQEFIDLLENNETWGFKSLGEEFMERADTYAAVIIEDVHSASRVPVETWALFSAMLPFGKSLNVLSDLALVLPEIVKKIVLLDQKTDSEDVLIARNVILERLNILVRKELHNQILTSDRKTAIRKALGQINGHYE